MRTLDSALRVGGVVLVQRTLDGGGSTDRCHIGGKGDEEPIAQRLAYRPPNAATWCCTIAACSVRMSSASWSPRARRSSVEPTTSVIMIVSAFAARLRSGKDCLPCWLLSCGSAVQNHGAEV